MNDLFRAKEYLKYLIRAKGITNMHSPFVFDFMKNVLHDQRHFYAYEEIEKQRLSLLSDDKKLQVTDYGTGTFSKRSVKSILNTSVKPALQSQLFFRMADHYQCRRIIELGTSLGFTTLYLAAADKSSGVITLEGDPAVAETAEKNFQALEAKNIQLIAGRFETTFPAALREMERPDLIFFDGNHRKIPTIAYFKMALPYCHEHSILIFDDIHWSPEMKEAWLVIQSNQQVTLTLDLFYFGIVFFKKELSKQNLTLRH